MKLLQLLLQFLHSNAHLKLIMDIVFFDKKS